MSGLNLTTSGTKSFWVAIIATAIALLGAVGIFFFGYLKGTASCQAVNAEVAKESLEISQQASGRTAQFTAAQRDLIADLQNQLTELRHECLESPMPSDLIDLLNQ